MGKEHSVIAEMLLDESAPVTTEGGTGSQPTIPEGGGSNQYGIEQSGTEQLAREAAPFQE
jgi:hypothetical protein